MSAVKAAKHLGQHFLRDEGSVERIVDALAGGGNVIEIGPGLGALTLPLLRRFGQVTAIEFDRRVLAPLSAAAQEVGALHLIEGDILRLPLDALGVPQPWSVVGNLPYNLSSPILFHCLQARASIAEMVFMLQKEVVARLCAEPGSKRWGRLSVMVQRWCRPEYLFSVPPEAFEPPPKVDSAVVRLEMRPSSAWEIADDAAFDAVVRAAFGQRRKMLRKSLAPLLSAERIAAADVDPQARPEQLSGADFARLANAFHAPQ